LIEKLEKVLEKIDSVLQDLPDKGKLNSTELLKKCQLTEPISDLLFNELVRFYISHQQTFIITRGRYGGIGRKPTTTPSPTINPRDSCPAVGVQSLVDLTKEP